MSETLWTSIAITCDLSLLECFSYVPVPHDASAFSQEDLQRFLELRSSYTAHGRRFVRLHRLHVALNWKGERMALGVAPHFFPHIYLLAYVRRWQSTSLSYKYQI